MFATTEMIIQFLVYGLRFYCYWLYITDGVHLIYSSVKQSSIPSTPPPQENIQEHNMESMPNVHADKVDSQKLNRDKGAITKESTKKGDNKPASKSAFKRLSLKMRQQSKEEEGVFNFKARLKKTHVNPDEIKKDVQPTEEEAVQVDFRSVLKKRKETKDKQSKRIVVDKK